MFIPHVFKYIYVGKVKSSNPDSYKNPNDSEKNKRLILYCGGVGGDVVTYIGNVVVVMAFVII